MSIVQCLDYYAHKLFEECWLEEIDAVLVQAGMLFRSAQCNIPQQELSVN